MSSLSKPCHSNPGAMPSTPISSTGQGTPKAGQFSGAGHRSAPATPLAKTTPTSERPSGAGLCTLPATLLRRTARRAEKDSGAGHGARPVTSGRHGQTVQSKNTLVRYHALLVLRSCKMSLWGSLKQKMCCHKLVVSSDMPCCVSESTLNVLTEMSGTEAIMDLLFGQEHCTAPTGVSAVQTFC